MNNQYEEKRQGLKERVLCEVGKRMVKLAVDPRGCWNGTLYEPELLPEIIAEMQESC